MKNGVRVRLENWGVTYHGNPYKAPELRTRALCGNVYGHPKFPDGTFITTSAIQGKRGEFIVTCSREYELGDVAKDYEGMFPGARQRLLASATPLEEIEDNSDLLAQIDGAENPTRLKPFPYVTPVSAPKDNDQLPVELL